MTVRSRAGGIVTAGERPAAPAAAAASSLATGSAASAVARHGRVGAVFLAGHSRVRPIFDACRANCLRRHGERAPLDRRAYRALIRADDSEAGDGANRSVRAGRQGLGAWGNPPGHRPPELAASSGAHASGSGGACSADFRERMRCGNVFAGTPDQACRQGVPERSGGFGQVTGQADHLSAERVLRSTTLCEREAYPRPREVADAWSPGETAEKRKSPPMPTASPSISRAEPPGDRR